MLLAMPPSVPRTAISFASPFPIGQSPFRIKGVLYQGTVSYFTTKVKGGMDALLHQIDDEQLRAFISQRFLAASFYDVLPVHPLIHAEARACNLPLAVYLRQRSEYQAEQDIGGVYKVLLKLASPEAVLARFPRLATQLLNFAKAELTDATAEGVRGFTLSGMPAHLVAWYMNGLAVYAQHAVKLAGAKNCQVTMLAPEPEGQAHGLEIVRVRFQVQWT
jgi:hypothetical protein